MSVYFPLSVLLGFSKCFLKEEDPKIQLCKRSVQTVSRPPGPGRGAGGLSAGSALLVFLTPPSSLSSLITTSLFSVSLSVSILLYIHSLIFFWIPHISDYMEYLSFSVD